MIFILLGAATCITSAYSGSKDWIAYECVDWDGLFTNDISVPRELEWKEASDIQVAGMIAFCIVTKEKHPFGAPLDRMRNLYDDNPVGLKKLSDPVVKDLLSQMLAREQEKRPYVEQALKHPFFLSSEEQMKFLEAVGNEPEIKNSDSYPHCAVSNELDNRDSSKPRSSLLPNNWKAVIDPDDLNTFCGGGRPASSYDGKRYTHFLRFIRYACQQWYGIHTSQPLKGMGSATSPDEYFLQIFSTLPLVVHQIISENPDWKKRRNLKEFFPAIDCRIPLGQKRKLAEPAGLVYEYYLITRKKVLQLI